LSGLYSRIEPYDRGMLDVGDGNCIYWDTCGIARHRVETLARVAQQRIDRHPRPRALAAYAAHA